MRHEDSGARPIDRSGGAILTESADTDLTEFCKEAYPKLVGSLSLYCGQTQVAEDLSHEALARVCRDWARVRRMENPRAWTLKVGMNLANSYFRRKKAERRAFQRAAAMRPLESAETDSATAISVRQLVAGLPRRQRQAVILRFYADLSFQQIATLTGIPESTVKSHVRRGLKKLIEPALALSASQESVSS